MRPIPIDMATAVSKVLRDIEAQSCLEAVKHEQQRIRREWDRTMPAKWREATRAMQEKMSELAKQPNWPTRQQMWDLENDYYEERDGDPHR